MSYTRLWREAHLQMKKLKTPQPRSTFGSWDVEKAHAVVARSTCPSQNIQNTSCLDHFKVEMSKKCTLLWRKAHFEVKMYKAPHVCATFGHWRVILRGRRKRLCTLSKVSKTWGFCGISKNDGRRGTFEEDLQRCSFRGTRGTRDMFIRAVRRSGRWFPEKGCILAHQIFSFGKMILRDRCTSALHSTFHFWKKSCRIVSFLMLSTSKIEEVSQACFVFDVVKFKNWGSLAEFFCFWCCQVQKLRKSRRIPLFSSLQIGR